VAAVAGALKAALQARALRAVVVDPVLVATSGDALAKQGVSEAMRAHLLPLATVLTPNLPEASALLGGSGWEDGRICRDVRHAVAPRTAPLLAVLCCGTLLSDDMRAWKASVLPPRREHESTLCAGPNGNDGPCHDAGGRVIDSLDAMKRVAAELHALGPRYVLVKGGHLTVNLAETGKAVDVLYDGSTYRLIESHVVECAPACPPFLSQDNLFQPLGWQYAYLQRHGHQAVGIAIASPWHGF
jgi:hydroxymethylpyrimidine/phosphomethylpyrimidine kinase